MLFRSGPRRQQGPDAKVGHFVSDTVATVDSGFGSLPHSSSVTNGMAVDDAELDSGLHPSSGRSRCEVVV